MWMLRDVCKMVGVTRRTLQEYDKIGLLHPTTKTEAGYWLYDETAVRRLYFIQSLVEIGYKRKAVKVILEDPTWDFKSDSEYIISALEEKRRYIDGMINYVKLLKFTASLPDRFAKIIDNFTDITEILNGKSFTDNLNEAVKQLSGYTTHDMTEAELILVFCADLMAIGSLSDKPIDDPDVIEYVKPACEYLMNMFLWDIISDIAKEGTKTTSAEIAKRFSEVVTPIFSEPKVIEKLEPICGENTLIYINKAINEYFSSLTEYDYMTVLKDVIGEKVKRIVEKNKDKE